MTRTNLIFLAAGGSLLLLAGAFLFQSLGYLPCKMCLWQRWPHFAAVVIGVLAVVSGQRILAWAGGLAALTTAGIGIYHSGVERALWEGPASCTGAGPGLGGLTGADLLSLDAPALVLCDQVSWEFLTLSMASWNALFSMVLVALWVMAARRPG
ncbi:disulfide bond formation protein B [Flavimaricola sp.]|nr:disulfide bond formation protein B [Flavimaricola sp.]MDA9019974.1 disulfide bond formation protein B [Flavimaricola sp.]